MKVHEIITDYTDEDGNVYIDCYRTEDPNEDGVCAGHVTPEGEFVRGEHAPDSLFADDKVLSAILQVKQLQLSTSNA